MNEFSRSLPGRLVTAAAGVSLAGGGLSAFAGGSTGVAIMCFSMLCGVILSVIGSGYATEDHPTEVGLIAVLGPFALFVYILGLGLIREYAPSGGYPLIALGLLALSRAILVNRVAHPAVAHSEAHAH